MLLDKLFWIWFLLAALAAIYLLPRNPSKEGLALAFILVGMGILKLAEESRRGKCISRRLLEKLWKQAASVHDASEYIGRGAKTYP